VLYMLQVFVDVWGVLVCWCIVPLWGCDVTHTNTTHSNIQLSFELNDVIHFPMNLSASYRVLNCTMILKSRKSLVIALGGAYTITGAKHPCVVTEMTAYWGCQKYVTNSSVCAVFVLCFTNILIG
jgi:hypothetical protein